MSFRPNGPTRSRVSLRLTRREVISLPWPERLPVSCMDTDIPKFCSSLRRQQSFRSVPRLVRPCRTLSEEVLWMEDIPRTPDSRSTVVRDGVRSCLQITTLISTDRRDAMEITSLPVPGDEVKVSTFGQEKRGRSYLLHLLVPYLLNSWIRNEIEEEKACSCTFKFLSRTRFCGSYDFFLCVSSRPSFFLLRRPIYRYYNLKKPKNEREISDSG